MSAGDGEVLRSRAFQQALVRMCLAESEDGCQSGRSVDGPELPLAWLTYRRLVRARLHETLEHAFERLATRLGGESFCALVARFLASAPPRATILRVVPREFLAFLEAGGASAHGLPAWGLDLARFEWLELEVAYEEDDIAPAPLDDLDPESRIVATRACRVLDLGHDVHRLLREEPHAPIDEASKTVCIYRDRTTFDVRTLELSAPAAALVRAAATPGGATFAECVKAAADASGGTLDASWLEAFAALAVDLGARGILQRGAAA